MLLRKILARLREPSTMAGLAGLATLFGMPANMVDIYAKGAAALLGMAAVVLAEEKPPLLIVRGK